MISIISIDTLWLKSLTYNGLVNNATMAQDYGHKLFKQASSSDVPSYEFLIKLSGLVLLKMVANIFFNGNKFSTINR